MLLQIPRSTAVGRHRFGARSARRRFVVRRGSAGRRCGTSRAGPTSSPRAHAAAALCRERRSHVPPRPRMSGYSWRQRGTGPSDGPHSRAPKVRATSSSSCEPRRAADRSAERDPFRLHRRSLLARALDERPDDDQFSSNATIRNATRLECHLPRVRWHHDARIHLRACLGVPAIPFARTRKRRRLRGTRARPRRDLPELGCGQLRGGRDRALRDVHVRVPPHRQALQSATRHPRVHRHRFRPGTARRAGHLRRRSHSPKRRCLPGRVPAAAPRSPAAGADASIGLRSSSRPCSRSGSGPDPSTSTRSFPATLRCSATRRSNSIVCGSPVPWSSWASAWRRSSASRASV